MLNPLILKNTDFTNLWNAPELYFGVKRFVVAHGKGFTLNSRLE